MTPGTIRLGKGDVLALATLLGTAVIVAFPVLSGGHLTYLDNPVHLAEIYDLARSDSNGWSEIGFGGIPLATLHSPLWYPLLAWLTRHGAPLEVLYRGFLFAGFVAPSVALYFVARRRTCAGRAGVLAYLFLVQAPMLWGIGSPLGGMWTHALSTAGLVALVDLYARPELGPREHFGASLMLAASALTHLFFLPVFALVAAVTTFMHRRSGAMTPEELRRRIVGWVVAATASAQYWLTLVVVGNETAAPHQNFGPLETAARLVLPADPMWLLENRVRDGLRWDLFLTDAVPMVLLVGLGIVGFFLGRRSVDPLPKIAFVLSVLLLGLLVVDRYFPIRSLGPVSFRLIEGVRLGLALAAIPAVARLPLPAASAPQLGMMAVFGGIALGVWWGLPLRLENPERIRGEVEGTRALWEWLRRNAKPEWGRLYIQDTFGHEWPKGGMAYSHILTLTSHHTGLPQLGPYYGVVPFALRWTLSEFNSLFTTRLPSKEWLLEAMDKTNAGALVTSNDDMRGQVERMGAFDKLHGVGRYTVWRRQGATDHPIAELTPANIVTNAVAGVGQVRFSLETKYSASRVLVKTSWHPWWRLEGVPRAWLRESPEGFLVIDDIPAGRFDVKLRYEPGRFPFRVSMVGAVLLLGWAASLARDARRRTAAPEGRAA